MNNLDFAKRGLLFLLVLTLFSIVVYAQLDVVIPEYSRSYVIDVSGNATPGARIDLFVNNVKKLFVSNVSSSGEFLFARVQLNDSVNSVKVSLDHQGSVLSKTFSVVVDRDPPVVDIPGIKDFVSVQSPKIKGVIDEPASVFVKVFKINETLDQFFSVNKGSFEFDVANVSDNVDTKIDLLFRDKAGNEVLVNGNLFVDTVSPVVQEHNLVELNPSFDQNVKIRGKVSEFAVVTVFLNDRAEASEKTDSEGRFSIPVKLRRDFNITSTSSSVDIESKFAWENKVRIVAVDRAKRTHEVSGSVEHKLCGTGGPFAIITQEPVPSNVNPRMILQGIQMFGFPFNASYVGPFNATVQTVSVRSVVGLSPKLKDDFDNDKISVVPFVEKTRSGATGYVQLKFHAFDPLKNDKDATSLVKETSISNYREGDCLVPGFGCMKFFLELDVGYLEKKPAPKYLDPALKQTNSDVEVISGHQRTCIKAEVLIDKPRPENLVPKRQLNQSIELLNKIIKNIDEVLEPLNTIGEYLFYGCAGGNLALYLSTAVEKYNCDFSGTLSQLWSGGFNKDIARSGLCDEVYSGSDKASVAKKSACGRCQKTIESNLYYKHNVLRPICDRISCPSAPTLQSHMKNVRGQVKDIWPVLQGEVKQPGVKLQEVFQKFNVNNGLYVGDDCAVKAEGTKIFGYTARGFDSVNQIYRNYKGKDLPNRLTVNDCNKLLRPANPACCGQSYLREWGSACGVPSLGFDTFDELKESACLAANIEGKNSVDGEQCNKLWNSVAGFCSPEGGASPQSIPTGVEFKEVRYSSEGNQVYLFVLPTIKGSSSQLFAGFDVPEATKYNIKIGYAARTLEFEDLKDSGKLTKSFAPNNAQFKDEYFLNAKLKIVELDDLTNELYNSNGTILNENSAISVIQKSVCSVADKNNCLSEARAKEIYQELRSVVGVPDQYYIVQPDQGLLRGVQCACIPSVIGWLDRWKTISTHVKSCFQTIMITGDGSPGVCQEVLSQYVCDFFFETLSCFTQKFNAPGKGKLVEFNGIGNVIGSLTSAGSEVSNDIRQRYGTTSMFKTVIEDQKLIHSACAAAFGVPWKPDLSALFKQGVESTPLPSQGLLTPCRRRFAGFNPTTNPKGLANWNYELGMFLIAGSTIDFEVELVCSTGYSCDPSEFQNGKCDCEDRGREERITIRPSNITSNRMEKDQVLNVALNEIVQADDPRSQLRYDKAVLKWQGSGKTQTPATLQQGSAECSINGVGGAQPPAYCRFDGSLAGGGAFVCMFGQAENKISIKGADADYSETINNSFDSNNNPKFKIYFRQNYPTDLSKALEARKFLAYNIYNENGQLISNLSSVLSPFVSQISLETNGDHEKLVDLKTLDQSYFGSGRAPPDKFTTLVSQQGSERVVKPDPGYLSVFDASDSSKYFVVEFRKVGVNYSTSIFETGIPDVKSSSKREIFKLGDVKNLPAPVNYQDINNASKTSTISYTVQESRVKQELDQGKEISILMIPNPQSLATGSPCASNNVVQWKAEFVVHDADENGIVTNQLSVSPDGDFVKREVFFNVKCR